MTKQERLQSALKQYDYLELARITMEKEKL